MKLARTISTLVASASIASCAGTGDAGARGAQSERAPLLVRASDGEAAVFTWAVRGASVATAPAAPDAFYIAMWADGLVLSRPHFISDTLHVIYVDPLLVRDVADKLFAAIEAVPAGERLGAHTDEFETVTNVENSARERLCLVGNIWEPDTASGYAAGVVGEFLNRAFEWEGREYAGEPAIAWIEVR
jgi:hypothetical protein